MTIGISRLNRQGSLLGHELFFPSFRIPPCCYHHSHLSWKHDSRTSSSAVYCSPCYSMSPAIVKSFASTLMDLRQMTFPVIPTLPTAFAAGQAINASRTGSVQQQRRLSIMAALPLFAAHAQMNTGNPLCALSSVSTPKTVCTRCAPRRHHG